MSKAFKDTCGYSKCESALEFHHLNPNEKDFNISSIRQLSNFTEKIKNELDKCILVCSNCHREIHSNIIKI
jgi:predicted HNH restriction endonuclease